MKSREYNLAPEEKTAREQMMELRTENLVVGYAILISSRFTSSITVENEEKHFNGKSILKAGELKKGERFYVVADGSDAKEAIEALDRLFPCAVNQPDVQSCPSKKMQKRR